MKKDKLQVKMDKFYKRYSDEKYKKGFWAKEFEQCKKEGLISEEEYEKSMAQLKYMSNFGIIFGGYREENLEKYSDSIMAYNCIINDTVKLCHELNLNDSLSVFAIFDYLLWNGYFSENKNYAYSFYGRTNIFGYFGTDIINGKGVCLNKAAMLDRILKSMNYESFLIVNKPSKKIVIDYIPSIEREVTKQSRLAVNIISLFCNPITNVTGNHACTMVKTDNLYHIYDPTNLCVFKLNKFLEADIIGGNGSIDIKPASLSYFEDLSNKKIVDIVESYNNINSENQFYSIDQIKSSFETNIELCRNNTKLLNDFYDANQSNRNKVLQIYKKL